MVKRAGNRKTKGSIEVEALRHESASRKNIPTMELQSFIEAEEAAPISLSYKRRFSPEKNAELYARNPDLDPQLVWAGNDSGDGAVQLVWKGKDEEDGRPLTIEAVPIYTSEKIHPKAVIEDIRRRVGKANAEDQPDLFADFNGIDEEDRLDFYQHDQRWSNRMILGDSLSVMASLAEKEGLRGKVQCVYMDPPYGIKFNSNWQVSTRDRDVKDGKRNFVSREPEVVRAFRDTWANGIHSYLDYVRDRLVACHDLLSESGSIFFQIGEENIHLVRSLLDEIFGPANHIATFIFNKTAGSTAEFVPGVYDAIVWYAKDRLKLKYRQLYRVKDVGGPGASAYNRAQLPDGRMRSLTKTQKARPELISSSWRIFRIDNLTSQSVGREKGEGAASWFPVEFCGRILKPGDKVRWKTNQTGMARLNRASRLSATDSGLYYVRYLDDFRAFAVDNVWNDTVIAGYASDKQYVVETSPKVVERCLLFASDPGDLVLDPTCGSGTTAFIAEQWGRRWITIDTSRVALTLARSRLMGARYPFYALKDSEVGALAEEEWRLGRKLSSAEANAVRAGGPFTNDVSHGFVYERVPHVTLKSIASSAEIDIIWDKFQPILEPLRKDLNEAAGMKWFEWQIPRAPIHPWPDKPTKLHGKIQDFLEERQELVSKRERGTDEIGDVDIQDQDKKIAKALKQLNGALARSYTLDSLPEHAGDPLPAEAVTIHEAWWKTRLERQAEIDASVARNAEVEYLVDRPVVAKNVVRVSGPFTVDSLSPHRVLAADEDDPLFLAQLEEAENEERRISTTRLVARSPEEVAGESDDFVRVVLSNLETAGVGNTKKGERLRFMALRPFPGRYVNAEGRYIEGDTEGAPERKAAIFIGPEYGTVTRAMIVSAAREAADLFDVLVVCGFAFEAHASAETMSLGRLTVLKVNMNQDLRMGDRLKSADQGNLFVVFGEPDVDFRKRKDGLYEVEIRGVDIFNPNSGEQKSSGNVEEDIACWFVDDDYSETSFFVRQAYFLGGKDPYDKLKIALKAEIDEDAWSILYSKVSRPFEEPQSKKIAVKVINHYGDEVMKVYDVRDARSV
jgi:adenine-specific DNA-methyltransferase